jgi:ABC-type amino acid transport substrate-binding protein
MKFVYIFLFLLFGEQNISLCQPAVGSTWGRTVAEKSGTLNCLWNESYGIVYEDSNGDLNGICVDILADFKTFVFNKYQVRLHVNFEEEKEFDKFMKRIAEDKLSIGASSVAITPGREKQFKFSPPFLTNPNILISNRNAKPLNKLEDLETTHKDFTIRVIRGSSHQQYAELIKKKYAPSMKIEYTSSSREIFDEMATNRELFTIVDCGEFLGAKVKNKEISVQKVDLGFVDKIGFVFSKKSDWSIPFNEFLTAEYLESSQYRKIVFNNLGSSYLTLLK